MYIFLCVFYFCVENNEARAWLPPKALIVSLPIYSKTTQTVLTFLGLIPFLIIVTILGLTYSGGAIFGCGEENLQFDSLFERFASTILLYSNLLKLSPFPAHTYSFPSSNSSIVEIFFPSIEKIVRTPHGNVTVRERIFVSSAFKLSKDLYLKIKKKKHKIL